MKRFRTLCLIFAVAAGSARINAWADSSKTILSEGWKIQPAGQVPEPGSVISTLNFKPSQWYGATVPSTVAGTLVDDKVYSDPFMAMNLQDLSTNAAFKGPWWYRKEFKVSAGALEQVWLNFDGINYRANIWVNGKQIADTNEIVGAYRTYQFNITDAVSSDKPTVVAVEIFPTTQDNTLAINGRDSNLAPPDHNMGLWREVYLVTTGPVALRNSHVVTKVDQPLLDKARLKVATDVHNTSFKPVKVTVRGSLGDLRFSKTMTIAPYELEHVEFSDLTIDKPRLWWPVNMGPQNIYDLDLKVSANDVPSDENVIPVGIREVTSALTSKGDRVFKINGKPILIRGGVWTPDLFLRPSAEREIQELRYVKDMNLNAIRFEGKTESGRFLGLCDREGILVIAGWSGYDFLEQSNISTNRDYALAAEALRDDIRRLRNHPSLLTFWYGSDTPPNARAESNYLAVLKEMEWPNPAQSSASAKKPAVTEKTGLKMSGPYDYVPPMYWYTDTKAGGAFGFNTEASPGPAVPPVESLRRMLPLNRLWPMDENWNFHSGGGPVKSLDIFTDAINQRFGAVTNVEDYTRKAQVITYDGERAMFEAYGRNKYDSTGVIQGTINNGWPSLSSHLYDYYLRPGGSYYGAKKACEPLHIQYSYDDRSVVVVNGFEQDFIGLKATARIYNLDMSEKSLQETNLNIAPDGTKRVFSLPEPADLSSTYFVKLELHDAAGKLMSENFYWLSTKSEALDKAKQFADFTALNTLPPVKLKVLAKSERSGGEYATHVTIENSGKSLAFFVHLKVNDSKTGEEILPVIWQDNYFSLLPGEKRDLTATYALPRGAKPTVEVQGWNVEPGAFDRSPQK